MSCFYDNGALELSPFSSFIMKLSAVKGALEVSKDLGRKSSVICLIQVEC